MKTPAPGSEVDNPMSDFKFDWIVDVPFATVCVFPFV
jgi:hypothetical protein